MAKVQRTEYPKTGKFAKGGSHHMFGKQSAGPQKPGSSAKNGEGGGKYAKGGKGHMFGLQHAGKAKSGKSNNK